MPDDPRLTISVFLGTIRAGWRTAHVAQLLLRLPEGRDEVATALINLVDLHLPVMRHLVETDAAPPCGVGLSEKQSHAGVQEQLPGSPQERVRLAPGRHAAARAHRHRRFVIGLPRRAQLRRPVASGLPAHGGVSIPFALPVSRVGEPGTLGDPNVAARVMRFIDELIWYVRTLPNPRAISVESSPF
jgi:hypothetical protein